MKKGKTIREEGGNAKIARTRKKITFKVYHILVYRDLLIETRIHAMSSSDLDKHSR